MKRKTWLGLCLILAVPSFGQFRGGEGSFHGGGSRGGAGFRQPSTTQRFGPARFVFTHNTTGFPQLFGSQQLRTDLGIPPVGAIPPLGVSTIPGGTQPGFGRQFRFGFSDFFGFSYAFPAAIDYAGYGGTPNLVLLAPYWWVPQAPPRPPMIVRPALHEYNPAAGPTGQTFSIAMRNGPILPALLAWVDVDDGELNYLDPERKQHQVLLDNVDRDTTLRMNREKNLELHLPERGER